MPKLSLHSNLQGDITMACRALKLHVHACDLYRSGSEPGFPDLVIIGPRGVLWRELKVPPDEPNHAQKALGYTLAASRQNYAIWTPADWESGRIMKELVEII